MQRAMMKPFAPRQLPPVLGVLLSAAMAALLACASTAHAESSSTIAPNPEPVTATMHKLASDVQVLLPLIYKYDEPATLADKELINKQISSMMAHVDSVATTVAPRADTYQISYQALAMQLKQAQQEFASGREDYGINLLRSATSVCATCHTQDDRPAIWMAPPGDGMDDSFVAGEFLFMTRQYDRAFSAYETWLREQETLDYDERTRSAFERLLLTALQMKKSSRSITGVLGGFTSGGNINSTLKRDLTDWISGIDELQKFTSITAHPEPEALKGMAAEWLADSYMPETSRPRIVWLRGELYHSLIKETDAGMIPDWLYWLALSDRVLEYRFYYSLADMYLKQCMLEYTDDPVAQRCYKEYENYIEFFYSGSGGTHIPADVEAELDMLRARVFPAR